MSQPKAGYHAGRRAAAWSVHAFTALGLVIAAAAMPLLVRGDDESLRLVLLLFLAATLVDALDGTLARRTRVQQVLPHVDGRRLDDIIDFHTYTSLPLLFVWRAGLLPGSAAWLLLVPLIASVYAFSRTDAKTDDGYFLGFPSYWNAVAFYLYFLSPSPRAVGVIMLSLTVLTVLPWRYLYPSRTGTLNRVTAATGVLWACLLVAILSGAVVEQYRWMLISLAFPAWYMLASWYINVRQWLA